jgi:hypothetical protein
MPRLNIEDYLFLDDATQKVEIPSLEMTVAFYVSALTSFPNMQRQLIITRPEKSLAGAPYLRKFLEDHVGDNLLVACDHYSRYKWLTETYDPEFVNKNTIGNVEYKKQKQFALADRTAKSVAQRVLNVFAEESKSRRYINRRRLRDAIHKNKDYVDVGGFQLMLAGFQPKHI